MFETLQSTSWFMFAAFGSGIMMLFAGFIKWADKGITTALPILLVAAMSFTAGYTAMAKSDDMTRDWLNPSTDTSTPETSPETPAQPAAPGPR